MRRVWGRGNVTGLGSDDLGSRHDWPLALCGSLGKLSVGFPYSLTKLLLFLHWKLRVPSLMRLFFFNVPHPYSEVVTNLCVYKCLVSQHRTHFWHSSSRNYMSNLSITSGHFMSKGCKIYTAKFHLINVSQQIEPLEKLSWKVTNQPSTFEKLYSD